MDFTQLQSLLEQAQVEQGEFEAANANLTAKKDERATAQSVLASADAAVAEAAAAAGAEKNDVIGVLQSMQTAIGELLATLQA